MRKTKKFLTGFTLVEVLVVIAIMAILAGVGFAALRMTSPSLKLNSAARDLVSDLRYAQQMAVTEQLQYGLLFATTTNSYKILKHVTSTEEIAAKNLPSGLSFKTLTGLSENEAVFNAYGAVEQDGSATLINEKGEEKIVEIRPSGFIKMR